MQLCLARFPVDKLRIEESLQCEGTESLCIIIAGCKRQVQEKILHHLCSWYLSETTRYIFWVPKSRSTLSRDAKYHYNLDANYFCSEINEGYSPSKRQILMSALFIHVSLNL